MFMYIKRDDYETVFSVQVSTIEELYGLMRQFHESPKTLQQQVSLSFGEDTSWIDLTSFHSCLICFSSNFFLGKGGFEKILDFINDLHTNKLFALCSFLIEFEKYNAKLYSSLVIYERDIVIPKWMVEECKHQDPLRYTLSLIQEKLKTGGRPYGHPYTIYKMLNDVKTELQYDSINNFEIINDGKIYRIRLYNLMYREFDEITEGFPEYTILNDVVLTKIPRLLKFNF